MFYKIKNIEPLDNFILYVTFENDVKKYYDLKLIFDRWQEFKILQNNKVLFSNVKIDAGGYGVSWNEDIDLSSYNRTVTENTYNSIKTLSSKITEKF